MRGFDGSGLALYCGAMRILLPTALVFLGGFAIMVLEIIGARYLAKDFGGSFYVWTSQIGVILIALALGYYVGGALADYYQRLSSLAWWLVPAGIVTALIPYFADQVLEAIISRHPPDTQIPPLWQKLDPALGSALVFLLPCFALATLSPYMIRIETTGVTHVGRTSGVMFAASTVGSIAGVFTSGYILIDYMRISDIFLAVGGLTTLLGLACLFADRFFGQPRRAPATGARGDLTCLCLAGALTLMAIEAKAGIVFDRTSAYHHIRVVDNQGLRTLSFDGSQETRMSLADPARGHFEYTEYFHMPWLWNDQMTNVLMIGLGGASTQRAYQRYYPKVSIETVEIDPVVVNVAREYFYFKDSPSNKVVVSDGRVFLRRTEKKYDAILMDAYARGRYGSFIPPHLVTKEFFELAAAHLSENGVLAYNVIGSLQGWRADVMGAVYRTMNSVFPQVYLFPANDSLNVVLIGTKTKERMTPLAVLQKGTELARSNKVSLPTFAARLRSFRAAPPPSFARSPILTDDFAPVDRLLRGTPK